MVVRIHANAKIINNELNEIFKQFVKGRPHGRTFERRRPRTEVRVRLTFTSYSYFCTMLKKFCPHGCTQHIISVVYENQCASDFSMKR